MNFNNFDIVSVGRNDYRIHFWFMTKSEAVNKMKKVDLSEKSGQLFKKQVIIMMEINTLEAMTQQQKYYEKSPMGKWKMLKVSKKAQDQQSGLSREEKNKKQYMQEIDAAIYLKKTDKTK